MSQAKIYTVKKAQKDQGTCGHCEKRLPAGSPYRHFTVGFRSRAKQVRCMDAKCTPSRSERESSRLSEIYAVIDGASFDDCNSLDDIQGVLNDVASEARGLSEEYATAAVNPNTGAVFNSEAEERGQNLEEYADTLEAWDADEEEPSTPEDEHDTAAWAEWEEKHGEWLQAAKESAQDALNKETF